MATVQGKAAELGGLVRSLEQQLPYERVRPCQEGIILPGIGRAVQPLLGHGLGCRIG